MTAYWCELALVDGVVRDSVRIEVVDGRFEAITFGPPDGAAVLKGFTIPGLANAHSHAFHRALRSRTQADRGSFWTWRDLMYRAAGRLDPDSYHGLARAVFAEMAMAGVTVVGEFHYLHHTRGGRPYRNPNAMGEALMAAADDAGIRITLLDTLYLHGGLDGKSHQPVNDTQRRFTDGTPEAWLSRVERLEPTPSQRIGAAIHSVRAVGPESMTAVVEWAAGRGASIHAHVSEQPAENEQCHEAFGTTPLGLLDWTGVLSERFTAVHATHVTDDDISRLSANRSTVCMCPTTERDLGDGIGPTHLFANAGVAMSLGSDSHAVVDLFEEARAIELHERLRSQQRGLHDAASLITMATVNGHRSLGWTDAGTIAIGNRADLVTVALNSVRTAGASSASAAEACVFAATAADITDVIVDGRVVVAEGRHVAIDVAKELQATISTLMED